MESAMSFFLRLLPLLSFTTQRVAPFSAILLCLLLSVAHIPPVQAQQVRLPNGEVDESPVDMRVKIPGGMVILWVGSIPLGCLKKVLINHHRQVAMLEEELYAKEHS
jgi:hypothetical protein